MSGKIQFTIRDEALPTWKVVDNTDEMNEWLLRHIKCHYQQMRIDDRPPMQPEFAPILSEQGTSSQYLTIDDILNGTYDPTDLNLGEEMTEFLKVVKMTQEGKKLRVPDRMTHEDFQAQY